MDIKREQAEGEFVRQDDAYRGQVSDDGSTPYPNESGRYHLYVSLACPWAHRTVILRKLRGLEDIVSMTIVDPVRDDLGWRFGVGEGFEEDPVEGFRYLSEAYKATDPEWNDRVTVPVLWDKETRRIVNNSEDDICLMFNNAFSSNRPGAVDLFPEELAKHAAELNPLIYNDVNNGVYRAGFAGTQAVYESSVRKLFTALDYLEERLSRSRFLLGEALTESDLRLFCCLIRFDIVYFVHFKCNIRRIVDYPNLWGFTRDVYQYSGIAESVDFDHIKRHYYMTHPEINPTRFVPIGPDIDFSTAHGRGGP